MFYTGNNRSGFGIMSLQTKDILVLSDKKFIIKEEEQLHKANLLLKKREKLGNKIIKFNSGCVTHISNMIYFMQKRQYKNLCFIAVKSMDLLSLRENIQKNNSKGLIRCPTCPSSLYRKYISTESCFWSFVYISEGQSKRKRCKDF